MYPLAGEILSNKRLPHFGHFLLIFIVLSSIVILLLIYIEHFMGVGQILLLQKTEGSHPNSQCLFGHTHHTAHFFKLQIGFFPVDPVENKGIIRGEICIQLFRISQLGEKNGYDTDCIEKEGH